MSQEAGTLTEVEILTQIIEPEKPGLPPGVARALMDLRFNDRALQSMNELAAKNREGTISAAERTDLEKYLRVGHFLNLLRAKAMANLNGAAPS